MEFEQMRSKYTKVVDAYGCLGILRINAGELYVLFHERILTKLYYYTKTTFKFTAPIILSSKGELESLNCVFSSQTLIKLQQK